MSEVVQGNETPAAAPVTDTPSPASASAVQDGNTDGRATETPTNPASAAPGVATPKADVSPQPPADKSYEHVRAWATRTSQENAELRRQLTELGASQKQIMEVLAQVTKRPYDPATFEAELKKGGPDYIRGLFKEDRESLRREFLTRDQERQGQLDGAMVELAIMSSQSNAEKYPDFKTLEPEMAAMAQDPESVVNRMARAAKIEGKPQSAREYVDALYQAVKLQHSQDAIRAAEAHGKEKATQALAREAATAVVAGGKSGAVSAPDPSKMSWKEYREVCEKAGLVKDY